MKYLIFFALLGVAIPSVAAPTVPARKRVAWEYASVELSATRKTSDGNYKYGAELLLPGGKVVFLETDKRGTPAYNTYLLNRLGAQGWELIQVISYRDSEYKYILKRQK